MLFEIYKDIEGYEGLYQVSNLGKVKALEKIVWNGKGNVYFSEKILAPTTDKDGYLNLTLHHKGKAKTFKIHRLVAKAFIDNPENKPQVNHKDGNKQNNYVDNLEWVTGKENIQHAYKVHLMNQDGKNNAMYGRLGADNPNSIPIYQLDIHTNKIIKEFDSLTSAARELQVTPGHICQVCKGKRTSAYGYKWCYKD